MDIETILQQEDDFFYKRNSIEEEIIPTKKNKSKTKKTVLENEETPSKKLSIEERLSIDDTEKLRDSVIDMIVNPSSVSPIMESKGSKFKKQSIQKDLTDLLIKYKFNPGNSMEIEAMANFMRNLESIARTF